MATVTQSGRIATVIAWVSGRFGVRVLRHYSDRQGPLLASGLAFQGIFAVFAALWVGFSIAGLIVAGNHDLQQPLIDLISTSVPGLIKSHPSGTGAIDAHALLNAGDFTWTGAIALVGVLVTAIGWLGSARTAIRAILGLPQLKKNPVLLKLGDLAIAIGFGVAVAVSAALSVAGSAATGTLLDLLGIGSQSVIATIVGRILTLALMFALDAVILAALFRVLSGSRLPLARIRGGILLGAVGLGALKVLGGSLLGVSKSNPLLASFAVILGLLIFFNFVCQVILFAAAWIAVSLADRERNKKVGARQ